MLQQREINICGRASKHYSFLLITSLPNTITRILAKCKAAYLHSGESQEPVFSVVTNCRSDEQKSEPQGDSDSEVITDRAATSTADPLMTVLRLSSAEDPAAHTADASQSRILQEIPVLQKICKASSTPRVISKPSDCRAGFTSGVTAVKQAQLHQRDVRAPASWQV